MKFEINKVRKNIFSKIKIKKSDQKSSDRLLFYELYINDPNVIETPHIIELYISNLFKV